MVDDDLLTEKIISIMSHEPQLTADIHFPLKAIANLYMLVGNFTAFANLIGNKITNPLIGVYGVVDVELPNPDVEKSQRVIRINIKNKSDFKSLSRAHLDKGLQQGENELILLYEHRRTLFGGILPGFHLALYPNGTWMEFFKAVDAYKSQEFTWPKPLTCFQPSDLRVFPPTTNIFEK